MIRRLAAVAIILTAPGTAAVAFSPVLPTDNDALLRGRPQEFYMFTDRDFEGKKSSPWEGGAYGFVRDPERIGGKVVPTRLHEGIDIKPVRRDASGEPLDEVRAIEAGRVVHVSRNPRDSNYGIYVVVEHNVDGTPVHSIYAHLAEPAVAAGQVLQRGERLGRLGYTGAGIDRRRAHLHLEIALMWHDKFESWHAAHFPTPNKHGLWNGLNLMGLDVAAFYLARQRDPSLTLPLFVARQEPAFRLRLPASPHFQLPARYPWLVRADPSGVKSWVATFTAAGFPVDLLPTAEECTGPSVEWLAPATVPYAKASRNLVDGPPGRPRLGESGAKLVQLLTWDPAMASPAPPGS